MATNWDDFSDVVEKSPAATNWDDFSDPVAPMEPPVGQLQAQPVITPISLPQAQMPGMADFVRENNAQALYAQPKSKQFSAKG